MTNPANLDALKAASVAIWNNAGTYQTSYGRAVNDMIQGTSYEWNGVNSRLWTGVLCWASLPSELPALPASITNFDGKTASPYWLQIGWLQKPGLSTYNIPTYTMTQYARAKDKSNGGWVVGKRAGKIADPQKGDFGIVKKFGGNWLCEGGSVQHDGRSWLCELQYTWSGDSWGFDQQIYDKE